ncbi:MAG: DNA primase [Candidatus Aminicenantes bacterium]|nr:DNA primase [Candidatus Aminicenantes bacterium]
MDVKEQIKRSVPITEAARLYVDLKPAGKNYKALCPFHTEKAPSFYVNPEKDTFACYGCNKFGDIFTLVQEMENISFPEAMNFLIDKFNIPIEKRKENTGEKKELYIRVNELALKYYRDNLFDSPEGEKARDYLKNRGINRQTIELFSLGYAENKWDGLYDHLKKNGGDITKAVELGLLLKGKNNSHYDRFRGRIIFPIRSESGTVIAFGGRTIFDDPGKYLNSPDTPLYKKSNYLYGFHLSKSAMRDEKSAILVEGYFDVISLYQHGIKNVCASLGTALTDSQIYLLKRFARDIYIFYDSDEAGITAALRGIEKMFEQDINPRIIMINGVKDPDDFIRGKGMKAFQEEVAKATDGFKFLLKRIDAEFPDWPHVPEQKKTAVERIKSALEKITDPIIMDGYKGLAADYFRMNIGEFKAPDKKNTLDDKTYKSLAVTLAEKIFLESILQMPEFIKEIRCLFTDKFFPALASGNIIKLIFQDSDKNNDRIDYDEISGRMSPPEKALFRDIFDSVKNSTREREQVRRRIAASFLELQGILNKRDTEKINREIKLAVRENNLEEVKKLTAYKYRFMKAMYNKKQEA